MFEKGDCVVYGTRGVCEIEDITTINRDGGEKNKLYYILRPCYEKESRIFTPVADNKTYMRKMITKAEAKELMDHMDTIEEMWISSQEQREACYKEALKSCDCVKLIGIIKTLYTRKQERISDGKKILSLDEKYLKMAEQILYSELSVSLGIPREEMLDYIQSQVQHVN